MLTILSLNAGLLQVSCFGRPIFEFAPYVEARASCLPELVQQSDADILCFQEVFLDKTFDKLRFVLADTHLYSARFPSVISRRLGTGLGVLSRLKIRDDKLLIFGAQTLGERLLSPRAAIRFLLDLPGGPTIALYNTHITAGGVLPPEAKCVEALRAKQLGDLLKCANGEKEAAPILVGDFNCGPEASADNYSLILAAGFTDVPSYLAGGKGSLPWVTWDPDNSLNLKSPHCASPPQRIDHIFVRGEDLSLLRPVFALPCMTEPVVSVAGGNLVTVSDHAGIKAKFNC